MSPLSGWGAKNGKRMIGDFWPIFKLVSAITDVFVKVRDSWVQGSRVGSKFTLYRAPSSTVNGRTRTPRP
jgi:hypothetical protein